MNPILIGAITGVAVFAVLTSLRNCLRNAIIRGKVTEDYLLGWKDACNQVADRLNWVKSDGAAKASQ